jgi:hypothetical protein
MTTRAIDDLNRYSYYAYTSLGYRLNLKFVITLLQISQFLFGFYNFFQYIEVPW